MAGFILSWITLFFLLMAALGGGSSAFFFVGSIFLVCAALAHFDLARRGRWYRLRHCLWYLPILGGLGGSLWRDDGVACILFLGSSAIFSIVGLVSETIGRRRYAAAQERQSNQLSRANSLAQ